MSGVKLTRESILDGSLHAAVRATLGPLVRAVVEFDRRHDSRRIGVTDDEVDMLLSDAIAVTALPIALATGDDVCQADFA